MLRLKLTLRHIRPPVWRRIEVRADVTLAALHQVLQAAMGWTDSHLHLYRHDERLYGVPDPEFGVRILNERSVRVGQLLTVVKDRLEYTYDFGDGWEHTIVLEAIGEAMPGVRYPRVLGGKRACPPEDVGGPFAYDDFLEALTDPAHDDHAWRTEWIGGAFDAEHFDVHEADANVAQLG
ncbi:MAG: plasmid pRiA4b ORF-3 family protein [Gemmatimonadetes bacterium]|nr:plasmid pRiA4b ORF-3 family protein [Gemmatimonadota bacterium]